jgi:DNA-binding PadR family transcriptional regulator
MGIDREERIAVMSAKEAVLGLIVDRPGYCYAVKQRFDERLGVAEFADSIVYSSIGSLVKDGYVEEVPTSANAGRKSGSRRNANVRATPTGTSHFEEWMAESLPLDPIRDELRLRLAVCQPWHVPRMLELVAAHEQLCVDRIAELKRLSKKRPPAAQMTLPQAIDAELDEAETMELQAKIEWLQKLRPTLLRYQGTEGAGGRGGLHGV